MSLFRRRLLLNAGNTLSNSLIARYACYDKTNEDEDRDVLKDLSGNGHDIQLDNFAFSKNSGYGAYHIDYTSSSLISQGVNKGVARNVTSYSFEYKPLLIDNNNNLGYGVFIGTGGNIQMKLYCEGINDDNPVYIVPYNRTIEQQGFKIKLQNGINSIHISYTETSYAYFTIVSEKVKYNDFILFKTIPDYKGALVSDGIDDCGFCDNFPILNKDTGYTIVSIRELITPLTDPQYRWLLAINGDKIYSDFYGSAYQGNINVKSFGVSTNIKNYFDAKFLVQTSTTYNSHSITKGTEQGSYNNLSIFCTRSKQFFVSAALYCLEIYNRDLTDEEISKVKARMVLEYESKTGESIDKFLMLGDGKLGINLLK
jgi:hypothetical protein